MIEVLLLILGAALILIGLFNLEAMIDSLLCRIIAVIVGVMLIVLVATACDPNDDCELEKNYGTAPSEVTACSS